MKTNMTILGDPQHYLDLSNIVYIAAAFLTVLATFCIVVFGNRVTTLKNNELKTYQRAADARIAEANATAATAKERAEHARADSAAAYAASTVARADAERAKADAAIANAQAERFRVESLRLEIKTQNLEQVNREQIFRIRIAENNAKPRELTPANIESIRSSLQSFRGQALTLWILSTDVEPVTFASELGKAFDSAGISCTPLYLAGVAGRGVSLVVHSLDDVPAMAKAISGALVGVNISVSPVADPDRVPVHGFALAVGVKSPFFPDNRLGEPRP